MPGEDLEQPLPELGLLPGRHPAPGRDQPRPPRRPVVAGQTGDDFPSHDQAFQLFPARREQTREPCLLRIEAFHLSPAHRLLFNQQPQHLIDAHQTPSRSPDHTGQTNRYRNKLLPPADNLSPTPAHSRTNAP
jgi:hypothetical protein